jgi:sugar phosphate isomerase/epimerase
MPRPLALDQLTVIGARPAQLVDLAADAGFAAISPWLAAVPYDALPATHLRAGDPETIAMARRMKETGVTLNQADGFALSDAAPMDAYRDGIALMAEMGARNIVALHFDSDFERGYDRFCLLDHWAKAAGIGIILEFTPLSRVATLADALAFLTRVDSANAGLLVDLLHLAQSGGTPADLLAVPPGIIRGAQLCDAPGIVDFESYARHAVLHRLWPGEGALPVSAFIRALPADIIIGVEIPRSDEDLDLAGRAQAAFETSVAALTIAGE